MVVPPAPKIYHIVHIDRLPSIIADGCLWCDAEIARRRPGGTVIGMHGIKRRRLTQLKLTSHPDLFVGQCVPFYFCPRSVMLYLIHMANSPDLSYRGGQEPIVHLEADLRQTVAWAEQNNQRWAFTLSNAGSSYFEDRSSLQHLDEINWAAVQARNWKADRDRKQAEFLVDHHFPWQLVSRIGVLSRDTYRQVSATVKSAAHQPKLEVIPGWYYG